MKLITLSLKFLFFVVYDNSYSTVVYGGTIISFPRFKALNNNNVHFYASLDLLMVCRTMQLRFLKLGTVLTICLECVVVSEPTNDKLMTRT